MTADDNDDDVASFGVSDDNSCIKFKLIIDLQGHFLGQKGQKLNFDQEFI